MIGRYIRITAQSIGLLAVLSAIVFLALVPFLAVWLQPQDPAQKSEYIIVLAGDPSRCLKAAEMYKDGYAPIVMISNEYVVAETPTEKIMGELGYPTPDANVLGEKILRHLGVPKDAIKHFGKGSISTAEEAEAFRDEVKDGRFNAVLVASPFQARRARDIRELAPE